MLDPLQMVKKLIKIYKDMELALDSKNKIYCLHNVSS